MPYEEHQEKVYSRGTQSVFDAAAKAIDTLQGKVISTDPTKLKLEVNFPKVIFGKTLGERTYVCCEVRSQDGGSQVIVDAYPLDAVNRKLMFGARKGVTQTVVSWFIAHLENTLGVLEKS